MVYYDIATRAQVVTLKLVLKLDNGQIEALTGVQSRTVNSIADKALDRGFNPQSSPPVVLDKHVCDAPKTGRPSKQDDFKDTVLEKVRANRYGREMTCAYISAVLGSVISAMTVWRILRAAGMKKTKPTRKPGLTERMRKERLEFCLRYQHWTLEDWKRVIWSDETGVILNHRRGGYRVWRTSVEKFVKSVIRERWKGYTEFQFWGCYTYDAKGPCHIWHAETAQERKEADKDLEALNAELEPILREEWELENKMRRLSLRNLAGRKPQWKWDAQHGKLTRGKGSGIDWYRYQKEVMMAKLIPFAKECGPDAIVQEDLAPSHAHRAQAAVFSIAGVQRMIWCPNSPDLNMIEQCWPHLKRQTTKKGAPKSKREAEAVWRKAWDELGQNRIREWIERIPFHIQEVIRLEGGNEYQEGRAKNRREDVISGPGPDTE
jgi:hypothetical protein